MRVLVVLAAAGLLALAQDPSSPDPKQREKAAKALAKEGSSAIERLQPLLSDPVLDVRRAAVESIVSIGGPNMLEPLTFSLRDGDPKIQALAANGLVNFYLPGYYQTGWKARIRRSASDWLEHFAGPDDETEVIPRYVVVRPEIITALGEVAAKSTSLETRAVACRALGVLRGRAASEQLLEALATKNADVLYEVLIAFEKIRYPEVAPRLFYLLRDPEERVQVAAIQTVAVLGNHDAVEPLMEAWRRSRNDKIRAVILEALAMLPEESSRPLFEENLLHSDEYLRAAAAEGLGRLGRPEDRPKLETLWEGERKMRPRLALAFAVVRLGNTAHAQFSPLEYLINTLNSKSWKGVAQGFLRELARMEIVRATLHYALPRATRDEKLALVSLLAAAGQKDSQDPLESLSRDPDAEVAAASMRALRNLRTRLP